MINPVNYIVKDADADQRLEMLLYSILVANKPAGITAKKLEHLISILPTGETLRERVEKAVFSGGYYLRGLLKEAKTGQYTRIDLAIAKIVALGDWSILYDTDPCRLEKLVGPKTARYFILSHTPTARVAALDTHILKFLRGKGERDVPKSTPGRGTSTYKRLEAAFLDWADIYHMSPGDLDLAMWRYYSGN